MPFNDLWGVGREPQVRGSVSEIGFSDTNHGTDVSGNYTIHDTQLPSSYRLIGVRISVIQGSGGTYPNLKIYLNGDVIADYQLNPSGPTGGDIFACMVRDFIPMNKELIGTNSLKGVYTAQVGTAMNFARYDVKAILIPL